MKGIPGGLSPLVLSSVLLVSVFGSGGSRGESDALPSARPAQAVRQFTLDNGLRVLLVSRPDAQRAAVAVRVGAGSRQDPDAWPGLAHLLEHMIFLGSRRYPGPDAFDNFVSRRGGFSQALTMESYTLYRVSVDRPWLEPLLDRLAALLAAPLFAPEALKQERHVIEAEFAGLREQELQQVLHVEKATTHAGHPARRFAVGNLQTLPDTHENGGRLRQALLALHSQWYRGNNLRLVLVSPDSLDALEAHVRAYFAPLPAGQSVAVQKLPARYSEGQKGIRIDMQTRHAPARLWFQFPLSVADQPHWRQAGLYLAWLLGQEGPGSLFQVLREPGWVTQLVARLDEKEPAAVVGVDMLLTPLGRQHLEAVVTQLFAWLALIRNQGISALLLEQMTREQTVERLLDYGVTPDQMAERLVMAPDWRPSAIPMPLAVPDPDPDPDPQEIRALVQQMTPDELRLYVIDQQEPTGSVHQEPWMGMRYSVQPFTIAQKRRWSQARPTTAMALPRANKLLPAQLALIQEPDRGRPERLVNKAGVNAWFHHTHRYGVPYNSVSLAFPGPDGLDDGALSLLVDLWDQLLRWRLRDSLWTLSRAGLSWQLVAEGGEVVLELNGFNDTLIPFSRLLLQQLEQLAELPAEDFYRAREAFRNQLAQQEEGSDMERLMHVFAQLHQRKGLSPEARLERLDTLTLSQLQQWIGSLLSVVPATVLINGNMSKKQAYQLLDLFQHRKAAKAGSPGTARKPAPSSPAHLPLTSCAIPASEPGSVELTLWQARDDSPETRALFRVLARLLEAPFESRLRGSGRLGYEVLTLHSDRHVPWLAFLVRSPDHGPEEIDARITHFLETDEAGIGRLDVRQLQTVKAAVIAELAQPAATLLEQNRRFRHALSAGRPAVNRDSRVIEAVRRLSLEQLQQDYDSWRRSVRARLHTDSRAPDVRPPACLPEADT